MENLFNEVFISKIKGQWTHYMIRPVIGDHNKDHVWKKDGEPVLLASVGSIAQSNASVRWLVGINFPSASDKEAIEFFGLTTDDPR